MASIKPEYQEILKKYIPHQKDNGPIMYNEQSVLGIMNDVAALYEKREDEIMISSSDLEELLLKQWKLARDGHTPSTSVTILMQSLNTYKEKYGE